MEQFESKLIIVVGKKGSGKTAIMTYYGLEYFLEGYDIVSNYHLEIPHLEMSFSKLCTLPPEIDGKVILIDEGHIGMDSRTVFAKGNKELTKLVTQIRKRHCILLITTQFLRTIDKRAREQSDLLVYALGRVRKDLNIFKYDMRTMDDFKNNSTILWDATEFLKLKLYNTDQIIEFGEENPE